MIALPDRAIVYAQEVELLTGRHRNTIREWWRSGKLPKPIKVGRRRAWKREVIAQFLGMDTPDVASA